MPAPTIFDTRTLIAMINDRDLAVQPQYLLDTFAPNTSMVASEFIEVDTVPYLNGIAGLVKRGDAANLVQKGANARSAFRLPLWKEAIGISALEIANGFGRTDFNNPASNSASSAMQAQVAKSVARLKNRGRRLEEYLFSQFLAGGFSYTNAQTGVHYELSLGSAFTGTYQVTLSGGNLWSAPSTCKINSDIENAATLIEQGSGEMLTHMVLGSNAAKYFKADPTVLKNLWVNNNKAGQITQDVNNRQIGMYDGVQVSTYRATYADANGAQQHYLHPDYVLFMGGTNGVRTYGLPDSVNALEPSAYYANSWVTPDESARMLQAQAAMLPVMPLIGSWVYMKVV